MDKGKRLVRLRAYNIYEIKPRTIPNEKGEPETYKRPYHIVEQGDTWEVIEKEAGVNRYALIWENGLDEATPLSSLVGQKFIFLREQEIINRSQKRQRLQAELPPKNQQSNSNNQVEDKEVKKTNSSSKQPENK